MSCVLNYSYLWYNRFRNINPPIYKDSFNDIIAMGVVERGLVVVCAVLVLIRDGSGTNLQLDIQYVLNGTKNPLESFSYDKPFTRTSASVPTNGQEGYVINVEDALNVEAVPLTPNVTTIWIALVRSTQEDLVGNLDRVRAAGYSMMLVVGGNDTNASGLSITLEVMDAIFPVVIVDEDAFITLNNSALYPLFVTISVGAASDYAIVLVCASLVFGALSVAVLYRCGKCCGILCCCNHREQYHVNPVVPAAYPQPQYHTYASTSPRQVAESLPVEKYSPDKHLENSCPVCMLDFDPDSEVKVLPCRHNFHPACIDQWLIESKCICPMCRQNPDILNNRSNPDNIAIDFT